MVGEKTAPPFDGEFENTIKPAYPRRDGDQRWQKAKGLFRAARKAGEPLETILDGVRRYAAWCERKQLVGTVHVKQAATFFGSEKCWREPWADMGRAAGSFLA
jgi:hypothetical protein